MAIRIDGTNTTANPGITGADTDTGLQVGTNELKLVTGGSEAVTVDSSQNVGIGTSSADASLHIEKSAGSIINLGTGTSTADSQQGLEFYGRFVNGVTPALPGQLTSYIREERQGASSIFDLTFGTATSSDATERMRILASGGITFNGDTAAANALDDYEEGTFTPTLTDATSYSTQAGYYTKVGRLVTFCLRVQPTAASPSANAVEIGGLPFTTVSITNGPYGGAFRSYGILVNETNINNLNFHMPVNDTVIRPLSSGSPLATNNGNVNVVGNFLFNGFYYTA